MPALLIAGSVISQSSQVAQRKREPVCPILLLPLPFTLSRQDSFLIYFNTPLSLIFTPVIPCLINQRQNLSAFLKSPFESIVFRAPSCLFHKPSLYSLVRKSLFHHRTRAICIATSRTKKISNCDSSRRTCRPVGLASEWRKKLACCHTSRVRSRE